MFIRNKNNRAEEGKCLVRNMRDLYHLNCALELLYVKIFFNSSFEYVLFSKNKYILRFIMIHDSVDQNF